MILSTPDDDDEKEDGEDQDEDSWFTDLLE
jgi:hypothetical protein